MHCALQDASGLEVHGRQARGDFFPNATGDLELLEYARANHVHILLRVPNTTHRTQPEDVLIFLILKRKFGEARQRLFHERVKAFSTKVAGSCKMPSLTNADLLSLLKVAWAEAFAEARIKKAWKMCGLLPFTRRVSWEMKAEVSARKEADTLNLISAAHKHAEAEKNSYKFTGEIEEVGEGEEEEEPELDLKRIQASVWRSSGGATSDEIMAQLRAATEKKKADAQKKKDKKDETQRKKLVSIENLKADYQAKWKGRTWSWES